MKPTPEKVVKTKPFKFKPLFCGALRIEDVSYHRNGVSGNGFNVILFRENKRRFLATVFSDRGDCAVLERSMLTANNITFGENSWRGDQYEPELRQAIKAFDEQYDLWLESAA